ncbi:MAG: collagen-like protein, partial [Actinobacteria bacterium]|nr:collagen-like protein [Actinomycetota bacterium]
MAIDKIFNDANVDGIADNIFGAVNNSVSEVKQMQQRKAAENVQMVVEAFKKIETNITEKFNNVTDVIEKRVLTIKDGRDGSSGSDGRNGRDGKPGRDGVNGKQGPPGTPGKDGTDGVDGVSVTDASIDFDGSLVISLSSGQQINVGEVVPPELERQLVELRQGGGSAGSSGDVMGPTASTDNAIVRFDGTTGKLVQNSVVTIADTTGNMAGVGSLAVGTTLGVTGDTSHATTPVLYSGDGSVSSGRLLGRYSYRTATPTTAYYYDLNNTNTITSSDSLAANKLATLIDSTITNPNALTAFGTSYGGKAAGLSFVSGTASDITLAAVGSAPLLNADINAVVVGYTSVGPRIAIQNYALNDDTANAISYIGAVHRWYPAGTEVVKISSTGLAVTGAATVSTTLGVTGATTL